MRYMAGMGWTVEAVSAVDAEIEAPPVALCARTTAELTGCWRFGTTLSAVARLEGGRVSPSFATLRRYVEATGTRRTVGLVRDDGQGT